MIRSASGTTDAEILARGLFLARGETLPNRLAKSATSERLAAGPDGAPSEALIALYRRWGRSGAALLHTGNVMVDGRALEAPGNVVVEDGRHLPLLARWAAECQVGGARLWMQLGHPGRQSPRSAGHEPVAPSAVPMRRFLGVFATPRALEEREIEDLVARFATTARVAREAGFAGVQLHGAHGYLIDQFLSPRTNLRTDAWGGSPENRRRFLVEVLRAVRSAVGDTFPVGIKINSADVRRGGLSPEEAMEIVAALEREGIDLIEISGGNYESPTMFAGTRRREVLREREAFFLDYAERVRSRVKVPLMLTGGLRTARGMAAPIAAGTVDLAGMARPMIGEPELPRRILAGEAGAATVRPPALGFRKIDSILQLGWYEAQLRLLGAGRDPDPAMGLWRPLASAARTYLSRR